MFVCHSSRILAQVARETHTHTYKDRETTHTDRHTQRHRLTHTHKQKQTAQSNRERQTYRHTDTHPHTKRNRQPSQTQRETETDNTLKHRDRETDTQTQYKTNGEDGDTDQEKFLINIIAFLIYFFGYDFSEQQKRRNSWESFFFLLQLSFFLTPYSISFSISLLCNQ